MLSVKITALAIGFAGFVFASVDESSELSESSLCGICFDTMGFTACFTLFSTEESSSESSFFVIGIDVAFGGDTGGSLTGRPFAFNEESSSESSESILFVRLLAGVDVEIIGAFFGITFDESSDSEPLSLRGFDIDVFGTVVIPTCCDCTLLFFNDFISFGLSSSEASSVSVMSFFNGVGSTFLIEF